MQENITGVLDSTTGLLENTTGVIGNLVNLGFISENAVEQFHIKQKNEMYSHTHMNVTPHIRQHVISELQEDEDLKDWWNRCRELVDYDYECLKNNQHKSQCILLTSLGGRGIGLKIFEMSSQPAVSKSFLK